MVSPLHYQLSTRPKIPWNTAQERSIFTEFPFDTDLEQETDDQFVVRTYLQFLWLPESIMPLHLLVPSLLRVSLSPTTTPTDPHPLHTHLKPLLQTARAASLKYTVELPQILVHGGGAGEIEEAVMWFALSCERADGGTGGEAEEEERWVGMAGPWEDPVWRAAWLERMERREFKIQILLYFLKLSLPGPLPAPPPPPSPKKRKRGQPKEVKEKEEQEPPADECLEIFMDKMSMWQLMAGLENAARPLDTLATEKTRDWMQVFFEEVVKPQFEKQLPDMCALMRSKLFPAFPSPSSCDTSPSSSRATSPDIPKQKQKRDSSSTTISKTSKTRPLTRDRDRSRSLSVSLAQERLRLDRERSVTSTGMGTGTSKKRMLNREVSMSRAFKPKPRPTVHAEESQAAQKANVFKPKPKLNPQGPSVY
ncbi:hypothetical protein H0H81_002369 [Sphagnurus paluster]|uniref:DNA replication regulator Sld3 C-terminal domain-containing protein n=1 Tax=Sphagnurus paluster TaxID=117069 RepID=A0A9P7FT45_9AGAR|nr:hypothetical protein H0H81_002369 [Sphagnurus paluster]